MVVAVVGNLPSPGDGVAVVARLVRNDFSVDRVQVLVHQVGVRGPLQHDVFFTRHGVVGRHEVKDRSVFVHQVDDDFSRAFVATQVCDGQRPQVCGRLSFVRWVGLVGTTTRDGEIHRCAREHAAAVVDVTDWEAGPF